MKEAAKHRWGAEVAAREQNARKRQIQLSGRDIYDKCWQNREARGVYFFIVNVTFGKFLKLKSEQVTQILSDCILWDHEGSSEGNFSNKPFRWIEGASSSVWDRWQVVLSLAEIQSWKMIMGFLFQGTTTKCLIQSVKHK